MVVKICLITKASFLLVQIALMPSSSQKITEFSLIVTPLLDVGKYISVDPVMVRFSGFRRRNLSDDVARFGVLLRYSRF